MDLGVQVAHPYPMLGQIVAEILRHALGECGHQHPLVLAGPHTNFAQQVIHLAVCGSHLNDGIQHTGGADHLFDHLVLALGQLPGARGGADEDGLGGLLPELLSLKGPVVGGTGKAKTMLNQHLLAALVAVVHGLQLGAGDMAFIHHQQPVLGEVINQTFRRRSRRAAGQMAGIIFDPVAIAHLFQHLQVIGGALFEALGLQQTALFVEQIEALTQFAADGLDGLLQPIFRGNEVLGWIDINAFQTLKDFTAGGIDITNRLDVFAKQFDTNQTILIGRTNLQHITTNPKTTTADLNIIAAILIID